MASNPVIGQLNDKEYIRWLKATQALNWTISVLRKFCDTEMQTLHQTLVGLPQCGGTACTGPCSSADTKCVKGHWTISCASNICDKWLTEIDALRTKTNTRLTMSNADIRQWPREPWQVAKVFMGSGQDQSSVTSSDTDASGILQLLANCKHFAGIVDMSKVDAVRGKRNELMHSKTMKLKDTELTDVIQTMTDLLSDHYLRHSDKAANQAVTDINQLHVASIDITDKIFLDNERNAWKQVLACQSSDITQNKTDIGHLMSLNSALLTRLNMIDQKMAPLEANVDELQEHDQHQDQQISQLDVRVTNLEAAKSSLGNISETLKEKLREKYKNSKKHETLDNAFIDLRLQKSQQETLPETIAYRDLEALEKRRQSSLVIELPKLFDKLEEDKNDSPMKVLIQGRAGSGKTTLVEYVAREWATKDFWPQFDYVFVSKLRELLQSGEWSLSELLLDDLPLSDDEKKAAIEEICKHSQQILYLVDGLDEYSSYRYENCKFPAGSKVELSSLISRIISGGLLPEAKVVVTSRPTNQIHSGAFGRVVEIYGFTTDGIERYVKRFCAEEKPLDEFIWRSIRTNPNLATFCHTPVQCQFVCRSLQDTFQQSESGVAPETQTTTQLYVKATHRLGRTLHPCLKNDSTDPTLERDFAVLKNPFLKHAALAKECMTDPLRIIFYDDDLTKHEFDDLDKQTGFLSRSKTTDPRDKDSKRNSWSFSHLSMQEFFAAVGLLLGPKTDVMRELENDSFVKRNEIVITFMAGLLGDPRNAYYLRYLGLTNDSVECKEFIRKLKGKLESDPLKMITFMYETQCKDMLDNVPAEIKSSKIYPMEMLSLGWVLVQNTCKVTTIDFGNSELDIDLVKQLCDALKDNRSVLKLILDANEVFAKEDAGKSLGAALAKMKQLLALEMWGCQLTVKSWRPIARGICEGCSKMERLVVESNNVFVKDEAGCLLGQVLASVPQLRELMMFRCRITLKTLQHIVDGIARGVQRLTLGRNEVFAKEEAGQCLGEALTSMTQLRELSMFGCRFTIESWRHLMDGLRTCQNVERLELGLSQVLAEEEAGQILGEALSSMAQLWELKVNDCNLNLKSWTRITEGISRGCPKMTRLYCRLNNDLTDESEDTFRTVLTARPSLNIYAGDSDLSEECMERLEATFPKRFGA